MSAETKAAVTKDILERLDRIAFQLEERQQLRDQLAAFKPADLNPMAERHGGLKRVITRFHTADYAALYELVHLQDNVKKYIAAHSLNPRDVDIVDKFKAYRIAANLVNIHKHGVRGRKAKSAAFDYSRMVLEQVAPQPDINGGKLLDSAQLINYEGISTPLRSSSTT